MQGRARKDKRGSVFKGVHRAHGSDRRSQCHGHNPPTSTPTAGPKRSAFPNLVSQRCGEQDLSISIQLCSGKDGRRRRGEQDVTLFMAVLSDVLNRRRGGLYLRGNISSLEHHGEERVELPTSTLPPPGPKRRSNGGDTEHQAGGDPPVTSDNGGGGASADPMEVWGGFKGEEGETASPRQDTT
ncbi:unnamed protein product [Lota lota]